MGRGYVLKVNLMILFLSLFMINMCTISIYWLRPKWLPFPHIRHYFWPEPKVWNYSNTRNQTNSIVPSFVKSALSLSRSWEGILQPSADGGGASWKQTFPCYPSRALPGNDYPFCMTWEEREASGTLSNPDYCIVSWDSNDDGMQTKGPFSCLV